jgi:hypothetical protein
MCCGARCGYLWLSASTDLCPGAQGMLAAVAAADLVPALQLAAMAEPSLAKRISQAQRLLQSLPSLMVAAHP